MSLNLMTFSINYTQYNVILLPVTFLELSVIIVNVIQLRAVAPKFVLVKSGYY
jgi:hypothetical protein